ncbi:MAG: transcriptional repressor [Nitrospiraceae bacterium]|nr:transcriptional repressor [Nitrospiraceae bacterium]
MDRYKNIGLKLTPQRLAILDFLEGNTTHPSAEEIFAAVSDRFPTMSFATVYNTLETLKEKGAVIELTGDPRKKRFDPNTAPHHHLICIRCRRIADVQVDYKIDLPRSSRMGFEITGNHIEFYGVCPACRKGGPEKTGSGVQTAGEESHEN